MSYTVLYRPAALRDLRKLPADVQRRLLDRIDGLANDPRGPGTRLLKGKKRGLTRLRVGDYRVGYIIDDRGRTVTVLEVGHRENYYDR